ncbi:VOC family protein [Sporocytophaga myxococcoides]|nr:VOC family protein [Sporocytophaga myxococcoides]
MERNVVGWFEIPVKELDRAKKFYSTVFEKKLTDMPMDDLEMATFDMVDDGPNSGGALVKGEETTPSSSGTVVYFSCDDIQNELSRVEKSGGKIVFPKTSIGEYGFIAHIIDTEGNRIGLHSVN